MGPSAERTAWRRPTAGDGWNLVPEAPPAAPGWDGVGRGGQGRQVGAQGSRHLHDRALFPAHPSPWGGPQGSPARCSAPEPRWWGPRPLKRREGGGQRSAEPMRAIKAHVL